MSASSSGAASTVSAPGSVGRLENVVTRATSSIVAPDRSTVPASSPWSSGPTLGHGARVVHHSARPLRKRAGRGRVEPTEKRERRADLVLDDRVLADRRDRDARPARGRERVGAAVEVPAIERACVA